MDELDDTFYDAEEEILTPEELSVDCATGLDKSDAASFSVGQISQLRKYFFGALKAPQACRHFLPSSGTSWLPILTKRRRYAQLAHSEMQCSEHGVVSEARVQLPAVNLHS